MEGYALLKVSGKAMGLDGLRREIGARFARSKRGRAVPEGVSEVSVGSDEVVEGV